ncbi:MAG: CoA pyrophosphatase [Oscillospiraceae bacterium]|nr:CoA pyrophosphatase [Oscillospiraceae bacterium]
MDLNTLQAKVNDHEPELILPERPVFTAVMIPLVEKVGKLHVLFEVRSADIAQGGEVSFPGGHVEPGEDARETARRETCEELLLRPGQVEILAPMHRMTDRGRLVIDSFVGLLRDYEGSFSPTEVERVFTVPLDWLLENPPEIYKAELAFQVGEDFPYELIPGGRNYPFFRPQRRFYFYRREEAVIWGMTADLLYHFIEFLKQGELP